MKREVVFLWIGLFIAIGLFFQNCSRNLTVDVPSLDPAQGLIFQSKPSCVFNGKDVPEGQAVTAFLNSTPEFTNGCLSETRTCQGGVLSGTFTYALCTSGPKACLFNGITVESGSSITAYTAPNPTDCATENRSCVDGKLSGGYPYSSCKKDVCLFSGRSLEPGEAFTYYLNSSGACQSLTGYCQSGGFLVNSQKAPLNSTSIYASCSTNSGSCLLQGQTVAQNQTFSYYSTANSCQPSQGYCDAQGNLRDSSSQILLSSVYSDTNSCSLALGVANGSGSSSPSSDSEGLPTCTWKGRVLKMGESFSFYYYSTGYYWMCQPARGLCAPDGTLRTPLYQPLNGDHLYESCEIIEQEGA